MVNTNKQHHKVIVKVKINAAQIKEQILTHTFHLCIYRFDYLSFPRHVLTWLLYIDISVKLEAECKYRPTSYSYTYI